MFYWLTFYLNMSDEKKAQVFCSVALPAHVAGGKTKQSDSAV